MWGEPIPTTGPTGGERDPAHLISNVSDTAESCEMTHVVAVTLLASFYFP